MSADREPDPGDQSGSAGDPAEEVLAANLAFYRALEQGSLEAMAAVCDPGEDTVCAHPGRPPLRGWTAIERSWAAIFANAGNPQVIVTDAVASVEHPVAWVTATENLLVGAHTSVAIALNVFRHDGRRWRLVAHHAGPLLA